LIAQGLQSVNPHWDEERLFQETKRLNAAIFQQTTYGEHLPLVVGPEFMEKHDLYPRRDGYYHGYSQLVEGATGLAVAHGAYRLHNIIVGRLGLYQAKGTKGYIKYEVNGEIKLSDTFFDPKALYNKTVLDAIIQGMMVQPEGKFDRFMTTEVSQKLFHSRNKPYGMDLASVDIQRGRDVGLSGYNSWLNFCGFTKFVDFDDMAREFEVEFVEKLKALYPNVDDIDLWTAGIHEKPLPGALVGKTFACLISSQFARLKRADRFWYENPMPNIAFTPRQLDSIRSMTMSRIICETGDKILVVQKQAFLVPSKTNPVIPCSDYTSLPMINFEYWREYKQN